MKALWLENRSLRVRRDVPDPQPAPDEALIRVLLAGICNTDLELTRGYYPFTGVLGHEFVGEVVRSASRPDLEGKRVVGEINVVCGTCASCAAGRRTHCERRSVLGIVGRHGALAEHVTLPTDNLHEIDESISNDQAVFAEPLAAALEVLEQVSIGSGERVVVLGAGKLGSLVAQVIARTGGHVTIAGRRHATPRHLAPTGLHVEAADDLPDHAADVVVECTGNPDGLITALRLVRPRGTIVLKSTHADAVSVDMSRVVVNEISLVGSRCGPLPRALDLLSTGKVDVSGMIEARYELKDGVAAFEHAARPGALKIVVTP